MTRQKIHHKFKIIRVLISSLLAEEVLKNLKLKRISIINLLPQILLKNLRK